MKDIFSLFCGAFNLVKTISKSMYRRCAIIASGSAVIAVVALNSTCYGGCGKNAVTNTTLGVGQADEDEENDEVPDEENKMSALIQSTAVMAECESQIPYFARRYENWFDLYWNIKAEADTQSDEEDKYVSADYINPIISITDEDYENLVRIVEAEATDLDVKAKILVANVVINRVFSNDFPDSVTEVVFQGNGEQFQPVMDGRFYSVELTESSYEAVDRALLGEDYSEGALFFAATASAGEGSWFATHLKQLFEYEGHVFFGYK